VPTDKIIARTEAGIGWLIFNNPARHNAMSMEMWRAVGDELDAFSADDSVRVVIMKGAGEKAFVSGADISEFEKSRNSAEAEEQYHSISSIAFEKLNAFEKPLIAMVQGYCIGGGLAVALCADMRIVTDDSLFAIPAARLGLGYGFDGIKTLVDLVGPSVAKEIFFTAKKFNADEALQMRIVNKVVTRAELEDAVLDYAAHINDNAPLTIRAAKRAITEAVTSTKDRRLEELQKMIKACFDSEDFIEGRRAFMEKRKPMFKGR